MEDRIYYLAFSLAPGIGPKRLSNLIKYFKGIEKAWFGTKDDYKAAGIGEKTYQGFSEFRETFDLKDYLDKLNQNNVQVLTFEDENYPENLKKIQDSPGVLYVKGSIFGIDWQKSIGVVGTRKMTSYGQEVTEQLVAELVVNGFVIVSGLAFGVDSVAHKTAIENNGKTIAVLGSGVDLCFPRENQDLYDKIIKGYGAVVSQFPLSMQPSAGTFPARNRIISGLSTGILVTEAGEDSGALITADYAIKQGRPVFAVPGPITSKQSEGTAKLLKNGAVFIQNAGDVLNNLGLEKRIYKKEKIDFDKLNLSPEEKAVVEVLQQEELDIDSLSKKTGISISKLNMLMTELELAGIVRNLGAGEFGIN